MIEGYATSSMIEFVCNQLVDKPLHTHACMYMEGREPPIRRDKVDSQFIVTKFSILHAGGRLLFIFHIAGTS